MSGNKNKDLDYYLPQTEDEWLATKCFQVKTINLDGKSIRCALSSGGEGSRLIAMVGGIPRDPEVRKHLPLINKLYGHLAVNLAKLHVSSVMYNQPVTGGSGGDWNRETFATRSLVIEGVMEYFSQELKSNDGALIGMSAGAYMAMRSVRLINKKKQFIKKVVLLSPGFYPLDSENVPYGDMFKKIISSPWNIESSPFFDDLKDFVKKGGGVLIAFCESDDPPIPIHMQKYCRDFARDLANEGYKVKVITIPGVAHNFRVIGSQENENLINNKSVIETAEEIISFLSE